jgi:hypothetical protein
MQSCPENVGEVDEALGRAGLEPSAVEAESPDDDDLDDDVDDPPPPSLLVEDRFAPPVAGGMMGFLAGLISLGIVHYGIPEIVDGEISRAAKAWATDDATSTAIAYVTAASWGAILGGCFATVTRYLRRFLPLLFWAVVVFSSLALLALSAAQRPSEGLTTALLVAAAAYAVVVTFALPLRKGRAVP